MTILWVRIYTLFVFLTTVTYTFVLMIANAFIWYVLAHEKKLWLKFKSYFVIKLESKQNAKPKQTQYKCVQYSVTYCKYAKNKQ